MLSYSQSTISKNSKENNPSCTTPNYLCRLEPVRGAGANQITERQEDAKKVGGAITESGTFVTVEGPREPIKSTRLDTPLDVCTVSMVTELIPRWIYANELSVNKGIADENS